MPGFFSGQAWGYVGAKRGGVSVMKGGATTTYSTAEALQAGQAVSMVQCYKKKDWQTQMCEANTEQF